MKQKSFIIVAFMFFTFANGVSGQEKPIEKCIANFEGGNYELATIGRQLKGNEGLILFIVVNKDKYNSEYLIEVAKRIKREYCNDGNITVVIFDSGKLASNGSFHRWVVDFSAGNDPRPPMRGFITFTSDPRKALLEYSSKQGEPTTETQIDLLLLESNECDNTRMDSH